MAVDRLRNYVAGDWVEAEATGTHPVRNPATGEILAQTPLCGPAEIDHAVRAAHGAFASWRTVPPVDRARYILKLLHLLEERAEELGDSTGLLNTGTLANL